MIQDINKEIIKYCDFDVLSKLCLIKSFSVSIIGNDKLILSKMLEYDFLKVLLTDRIAVIKKIAYHGKLCKYVENYFCVNVKFVEEICLKNNISVTTRHSPLQIIKKLSWALYKVNFINYFFIYFVKQSNKMYFLHIQSKKENICNCDKIFKIWNTLTLRKNSFGGTHYCNIDSFKQLGSTNCPCFLAEYISLALDEKNLDKALILWNIICRMDKYDNKFRHCSNLKSGLFILCNFLLFQQYGNNYEWKYKIPSTFSLFVNYYYYSERKGRYKIKEQIQEILLEYHELSGINKLISVYKSMYKLTKVFNNKNNELYTVLTTANNIKIEINSCDFNTFYLQLIKTSVCNKNIDTNKLHNWLDKIDISNNKNELKNIIGHFKQYNYEKLIIIIFNKLESIGLLTNKFKRII